MEDLTVEYGRVREETRFARDGTEQRFVVVPIFFGKHGPFTERFTAEEWADPYAKSQRIEKLRATLAGLPT